MLVNTVMSSFTKNMLLALCIVGCSTATPDNPATQDASDPETVYANRGGGGGGPTLATSLVPPVAAAHMEIAVGHDTILAQGIGTYAFYDRYGNPLNDAQGNWPIQASSFFSMFYTPGSPQNLNANPPLPPPSWMPCDPTVPPVWSPDPYTSTCVVPGGIYDTHATYDPVHHRFILAAQIRNIIWTVATGGDGATKSPGSWDDPYAYRYVLFAVSKTENPADGFYFYSMPEECADWPRIGVSGNYLVMSHHGLEAVKEAQAGKPLVTLYSMDDLAAGKPNPTSFSYLDSDMGITYTDDDYNCSAVGFVALPTHDVPTDPHGSLWGAAYAVRRSAHGENPSLVAFFPGATATTKPTVALAPMPAAYTQNFGGCGNYSDPLAGSIRGGFLYTTYPDPPHGIRVDQQRITTAHTGTAPPTVQLAPTWSANVATLASEQPYSPSLEVTATGAVVLGYVVGTFDGTLSLRETTFQANGAAQPEQVLETGPYGPTFVLPNGYYLVNRAATDPLDPQKVWLMGVYGTGGSNLSVVAQAVTVSGRGCANDANPSDSFVPGIVGCGGTVQWDERANLCSPGFSACTATQWAAVPTMGTLAVPNSTPTEHYWTDDLLGYSGSPGACEAVLGGGNSCGSVTIAGNTSADPMRVCASTVTDKLGNLCNWTGCGLDSTTNQHFGGCGGDNTAGALCCAETLGCASGPPDDVFGPRIVGCGGSVSFAQRASLCGPGYSVCTANQWATQPGILRPSNDYWTNDDLKETVLPGGSCEASTVSGGECDKIVYQGVLGLAPMRVCSATGTDNYGNQCAQTGCGLDSTANQYFGGCSTPTAGTLCCAD